MTARNEVLLVGRLAAAAEQRELPSGAEIATWRLVVDRDPPRGRGRAGSGREGTDAARRQVDTLDCVAWTAALRRRVERLEPGDVVQVEGALHRRFWRAGAGVASRYEVEVAALRRLSPASR